MRIVFKKLNNLYNEIPIDVSEINKVESDVIESDVIESEILRIKNDIKIKQLKKLKDRLNRIENEENKLKIIQDRILENNSLKNDEQQFIKYFINKLKEDRELSRHIVIKNLYKEYINYCEKNDIIPSSMRKLSLELNKSNLYSKRTPDGSLYSFIID